MRWNVKIAIVCVLVVGLSVISLVANRQSRGTTKATYSQFIEKVKAGEVAAVVVHATDSRSTQAYFHLKDGRTERAILPANYRDAMAALQDAGVNVEIEDTSPEWLPLLANTTPFLLLLAVWVFMMARMKNWPKFGNAS